MGIKKNVFGSQPEKENYYKLYRQWGDKYPIYHNLPILNIFDVKDNHPNFTFLKNTSIDYTLCDRNDRPLLCIEFDGMQDGFSSGKNYHPMRPKDLERQRRLQVKLSIAENESFPFFIVGYKEFEGLSIHSKLNIVDGIIGVTVSNINAKNEVKTFNPEDIGYSKDEYKSLPYDVRDSIWCDWLDVIYLENSYDNNPVLRRASELYLQYEKYFNSVSLTYIDIDGSELALETMFSYVKESLSVGAKCIIESPQFGQIESSVFLRNIKSPYCRVYNLPDEFQYFYDYCDEGAARSRCLVSNIASILTFEKLAKQVENCLSLF